MTHENDPLWADVGARLDALEQLLMQVPDESAHALQAHTLLNNVRTCKEEWRGWGRQRGAGRPQSVFLQRGDEATFCRNLKALLTAHLKPTGKVLEINKVGLLKVPEFFALLYDVCVQYGLAAGKDDLLAYYNLLQPLTQAVLGDVKFSMAYKTLAGCVSHWADYVKDTGSRVLLHRISHNDVNTAVMRQALSVEKSKQQAVTELARRYGIVERLEEESQKADTDSCEGVGNDTHSCDDDN